MGGFVGLGRAGERVLFGRIESGRGLEVEGFECGQGHVE
jgi:hypothetical protein